MKEETALDDRIKYETEKCPRCQVVLDEKDCQDDKASASVLKRFCPSCGAYNILK